MNCSICGRKSDNSRICKNCSYLLENGASEETIRKMLSDDIVKKIWKEDKTISEELAEAYYEHLLENYNSARIKKDSKENFGFNAFADGINLGLDIIMPLLDEEHSEKVMEKIESMLRISRKRKRNVGKF